MPASLPVLQARAPQILLSVSLGRPAGASIALSSTLAPSSSNRAFNAAISLRPLQHRVGVFAATSFTVALLAGNALSAFANLSVE